MGTRAPDKGLTDTWAVISTHGCTRQSLARQQEAVPSALLPAMRGSPMHGAGLWIFTHGRRWDSVGICAGVSYPAWFNSRVGIWETGRSVTLLV